MFIFKQGNPKSSPFSTGFFLCFFIFIKNKNNSSLVRMDEHKITHLFTELKTNDPRFLFQFTRSCDRRIIKCKIQLDKNGRVGKSVVQLVEFNLSTKQENSSIFSDDILNEFFTFAPPEMSQTEPGVYLTSCAALPDRVIKLHTLNGKFFMTTTIDGEIGTVIIGVHVTIDMPKMAPALLRGITLFGRNKQKEKFFTENLPVAKYVQKFVSLMMDKQGKKESA